MKRVCYEISANFAWPVLKGTKWIQPFWNVGNIFESDQKKMVDDTLLIDSFPKQHACSFEMISNSFFLFISKIQFSWAQQETKPVLICTGIDILLNNRFLRVKIDIISSIFRILVSHFDIFAGDLILIELCWKDVELACIHPLKGTFRWMRSTW